MTAARAHTLSRRALFRGDLGRPKSGGWHKSEDLPAGSGDVFWNGWADDDGVFVVGDGGTILHHDGAGWTREDVPPHLPVHALWGRTCSELWAVGWMGGILRYDGRHWQKVRGAEVGEDNKYTSCPVNEPLFAIAGTPDGMVWAVGDRGTILHFDGSSWQNETSGTNAHLRAVVVLEDGRVLAAGGDGCILIRDNEGVWATQPCAHGSNFTAALVMPDEAVLLAGGRYFIQDNGFRGDLVLWRGGETARLFETAKFSRFRALAMYRGDVVTVGDGGQIHRIRDHGPERIPSGTTHDLLGIVTLPEGEALLVGDFGTVLVGDTTSLTRPAAPATAIGAAPDHWQAMPSGTDRQLWGLWHDPGTGETYASGEEGTVLVLDRGKWEALPPAGELAIHAMNRAPNGDILAAGQLGEIHRFDGTDWSKDFDLHMDVTILSLWSDQDGAMYAAGDEGLVLEWDGVSGDWKRMPSGTRSALYGLWGPDAQHLLAVGDFGLVLRWNGTGWDEFNAGTEHFLFDVWGRGLNDIYVVGLSGTVGHFDGQRWTITPVRARSDLLAVCGTQNEVVAVGAAGIALHNNGSGWQLDQTGCTAGLRSVVSDGAGGFLAAGDGGTIIRRGP